MDLTNLESTPPGVQVRVVTLSFSQSLAAFDERPLRTLLADKEVLCLREHFFQVHEVPYLACVCVLSSPRARAESERKPERGAGQTVPALDPAGIALFQKLRAWRSERARKDGVPPYVIFNNRELAGIAQARPQSRTELLGLPGIGEGKVERYAGELLPLLSTKTSQAAP